MILPRDNAVLPEDGLFNKIRAKAHELKDHVAQYSGILLLLTSQFLNSIMVTTCKLLETDENFDTPIHPLQILFIRMFITYLCCVVYMWLTKLVDEAPFGPRPLRWLLVTRGVVGFFGVFGLYYSLQYLSLSDAVAITFLIPMVTAFLAYVLLHEPYSLLEGGCSLFSLVGVLLIAKPHFLFGSESEHETGPSESIESSSTELRLLATGVGLMGVVGASLVYIVLRKIGKQAHPLLSVSYFAMTTCVISFVALVVVPSLSIAVPQTPRQWMLFFLIGFSGFFMQFTLTAGVQRVKASRSALMIYSNMVFAVVWDLIIWGHFPGILSLLGIVIIIGNAFAILRYKLAEPEQVDIENIPHQPLDGAKAESISLQDFTITDESDSDASTRPRRDN